MLNKQKGNMYAFVTHTWNTIKGVCPHDCSYCFMKRFPQKKVRFDQKELETDLGKGNFIFVGSSCDMFAKDIPEAWILQTLSHCNKFDNKYLFQSKNPARIYYFHEDFEFPKKVVIGTTIETNRIYPKIMGTAPSVYARAFDMDLLSSEGVETMVTIEPILDFDLKPLVGLIRDCKPSWVNIGADSKGHNLPEPSWGKVSKLITELETFTQVKQKSNLKRIKNV